MSKDILQSLFENNKLAEYQMEVEKEIENASDRGIALICASVIDEMLSELLKTVLIDNDKIDKDLFKGNKALSTFDNKKNMAFYLGLISKNELDNITYLQRVRNKFAHQISGISFDNQDIINMCQNFFIPKDSMLPSFIPLQKEKTDDIPVIDTNPMKENTPAKERFIFIFKHLFSQLGYRMVSEVAVKRTEFTDEKTADKLIESINSRIENQLESWESKIVELGDRLEEKKDLLTKKIKAAETDDSREGNIPKLKQELTEVDKHLEEIDEEADDYMSYKESINVLLEINRYTIHVLRKSMEEN